MRVFGVCIWYESYWWVAQCLEVDIATQGGTADEAAENMREALKLHFAPPAAAIEPAPPEFSPPANARMVDLSIA